MRLIETYGGVKHVGYTIAGRFVFAETFLHSCTLHMRDLANGNKFWSAKLRERSHLWFMLPAGLFAAAGLSGTTIFRLLDDRFEAITTLGDWQVNERHPASFSANGRFGAWFSRPRVDTPHQILWQEIQHMKNAGAFQPCVHIEVLQFSDDGKLLIAAGGRMLTAWSIESKESVAVWQAPASAFVSQTGPNYRFLACSTDGTYCCIGMTNHCFLWEPGTGQIRFEMARRFKAAAFSSDSRLLALAFGYRTEIWELDPLRSLNVYEWPIEDISCIAFAPDGLTMAAGGRGGVVMWDLDM